MEDLCRLDPTISSPCSDDTLRVGVGSFALGNYTAATSTSSTIEFQRPVVASMLQFDTEASNGSDMSDLIKAQISTHPRYPNLLSAYIECRKIGAPPALASILEEICRENYTKRSCSEIGADPELDDFMDSYCEVLSRYKEELSRPFDEATTFFSNMESQLNNLCKGALTRTSDYLSDLNIFQDEAAGTSEEDIGYGEGEAAERQESLSSRQGDQDVKGILMRKYGCYLSSLRKDFLKKRKKGKLPKDARTALLDWWNTHYRWPYPTEDEKVKLAEITGLDQKQINNWFINQRKRHWKPSEDMRFALMDGVNGNINGEPLYFKTGDGDHI